MEVAGSAVEARPWRADAGPPPRVHTYPHGARPLVDIRVDGEWRRCPVRARYDWPTGKVSYQVEVALTRGGVRETFIRSYWWTSDPAVMRRVGSSGSARR